MQRIDHVDFGMGGDVQDAGLRGAVAEPTLGRVGLDEDAGIKKQGADQIDLALGVGQSKFLIGAGVAERNQGAAADGAAPGQLKGDAGRWRERQRMALDQVSTGAGIDQRLERQVVQRIVRHDQQLLAGGQLQRRDQQGVQAFAELPGCRFAAEHGLAKRIDFA